MNGIEDLHIKGISIDGDGESHYDQHEDNSLGGPKKGQDQD